jgi:ectoine hydroxylase-related dioxygenase (phytanoyl-CoA dioxygenase family)
MLTTAPARSDLRFEQDGALCVAGALSAPILVDLRERAESILNHRLGVRLYGEDMPQSVLAADGVIGRIAAAILGDDAMAVRAILFDKTAESNWAVPWHQDRTIAVRERREVAGFGPWSTKAGVAHVEPPFETMARMVTLRAHLDDCGEHNAPLLIAPGSHHLGRIPAGDAAAVAENLAPIACHARAGDVWIYSTPILHASERTRVPGRRRVLQIDYTAMPLPSGLEWLGVGKREMVEGGATPSL